MPPRKKKLDSPLESVEALLRGIQQDIEAENGKLDQDGNKVAPSPKVIEAFRARQLQAERLRAHISLQEKKLKVSWLASHEWKQTSGVLVREIAKCTCGARAGVLKVLGG